MHDSERHVFWDEPVEKILAKIRSADGNPGAIGEIARLKFRLFNASVDKVLKSRPDITKMGPGTIIGQRNGAICIKSKDAPIWIAHLKTDNYIKLPANYYLQNFSNIPHLQEGGLIIDGEPETYKEIFCNIKDGVATVFFRFLNGAMSTDQCRRLRQALKNVAKRQDVKVVVLRGSKNYFSNGINLNTIYASQNIAQESWNNINAINDCVKSIFSMTDKVTVAYVEGNAGAGGAMMPLAADFVFVNPGSVLNPHYKSMGLYGSEYWTYFLTKRAGPETAKKITQDLYPVLGRNMVSTGMVDRVITSEEDYQEAINQIKSEHDKIIKRKIAERTNEWFSQLEASREKELRTMKENFLHKDYNKALSNFVFKSLPKSLSSMKYFQDIPIKKAIDCQTFANQQIAKQVVPKIKLYKEKFGKVPGIAIILGSLTVVSAMLNTIEAFERIENKSFEKKYLENESETINNRQSKQNLPPNLRVYFR